MVFKVDERSEKDFLFFKPDCSTFWIFSKKKGKFFKNFQTDLTILS
jgi:hypothetical protein